MAKAAKKTASKTPAKSSRASAKSSPKSSGTEATLIRELAEILNDTSLSEIEMEKGSLRIRVARNLTAAAAPAAIMAAAPAAAPVAASAPAAAPVAAAAPAEPDNANAVKSPMVGTAYIRPSPEADAFVKVGDTVKATDTVLLIEAMKTFNPITAGKSGTITALLVEDGSPVEFGQPLFSIG